MGEVVSSTGFYNDRKVIRYADGTVEYPTLETIPFHQTQERIEAYRRLLAELERTGQPNHIPMHLRPQLPDDYKDRDHDPNEDDTEYTDSDTVEHYSVDASRVRSRKYRARNKIGGGGDRQELLAAKARNGRGDQQEDDSYDEENQDAGPLTCSKSFSNLFQLFRRSDLKNCRRDNSVGGCYGHVKRPGYTEEFEMREITFNR